MGHRAVRERVRPVPIQTGENWWFRQGMVNAVAVGASDLAMVDIMKISGVTGWMAALPTWHFQSSPQTSSTAIHNSH